MASNWRHHEEIEESDIESEDGKIFHLIIRAYLYQIMNNFCNPDLCNVFWREI